MPQVIINIAERTYSVAKEKAQSCGYLTVEEYVSDWLEAEAAEIPMTPELAGALEEGLADSSAGRVVSLEELNRQHEEMRTQWMVAHPA